MRTTFCHLVLCLLVLQSTAFGGPPQYTVIDLGSPVGLPKGDTATQINPIGLDSNGDVVGDYELIRFGQYISTNAFLYTYSTKTMVTLTPPSPPYVPSFAYGIGINDSGNVVGSFQDAASDTHGFLYSNGTYTDLTPSGTQLSANAINNNNLIAGTWTGGHGAFLSNNGGPVTDLCAFPSQYTRAVDVTAINSSGVVVGDCYSTAGNRQAFVYSGGSTATVLPMLSGSYNESFPYGINASGQIVGQCTGSGDSYAHAFLYNNGTLTDLGTFGGNYTVAFGINDAGTIVGFSDDSNRVDHAFIYANGTMTDLNSLVSSSGWNLAVAQSINDNGWITGTGTNPAGDYGTPYLLTLATPEPSSLVLCSMGAASMLFYAWRRRKRAA